MRVAAILFACCVTVAACGGAESAREDEAESPRKINPDGGIFNTAKQRRDKAIELPPDLINTTSETIQENNAEAEQQAAVLPEVIGARIVRDNGRRWLHVETDAARAWEIVREFWAANDIKLTKADAAAGIMETEWFDVERPRDEDASLGDAVKEFLNRVTGAGAVMDKFSVRFERDRDATNLYVAHQGVERITVGGDSRSETAEFEWVAVPANAEKVAQLLQTIVLLFDRSPG